MAADLNKTPAAEDHGHPRFGFNLLVDLNTTMAEGNGRLTSQEDIDVVEHMWYFDRASKTIKVVPICLCLSLPMSTL